MAIAKVRITAIDDTQRAIRGVQHRMNRLSRTVSRVSRNFSALAAISGGAFAIKGVVQAGIDMERFERSLKFATGSAAAGAKEMLFLRGEASRLGLNLQEAAGAYTKLAAASRGTNLEGEATREIFTAISEASRVMGLSADQTGGALRAIEQMISKGNVQAEELRGQLGERLPGAFETAARAMGVTTQELNKMLDNGQVLADDLLPKLAAEMRKMYGPDVAAAASDAQSAIERFKTAVFDLQATIAEGGVLDAVSSLADKMRMAMGGATIEEEIAGIENQIEQLQLTFISAGGMGRAPGIVELKEKLKDLHQELARVGEEEEELGFIHITARRRTSNYEKDLEKLQNRYKTTAREIEILRSHLRRFGDDLGADATAAIRAEIDRLRMAGLEEITIDVKKRFTKPVKAEMDEVAQAAEQAARNIQDAFAQFFFDPFEEGLKGVVKGFLNAMRTMLANKAATEAFGFLSKLFNGGGGGGGGLSSAIGKQKTAPFKKRAAGGPVSGGQPYMVGEKGPELFVPHSSGNIIPNNKVGGGNVIINQTIDARGADEARIMRVLPPILEQSREQTKAEIMQLRMEGRFA